MGSGQQRRVLGQGARAVLTDHGSVLRWGLQVDDHVDEAAEPGDLLVRIDPAELEVAHHAALVEEAQEDVHGDLRGGAQLDMNALEQGLEDRVHAGHGLAYRRYVARCLLYTSPSPRD